MKYTLSFLFILSFGLQLNAQASRLVVERREDTLIKARVLVKTTAHIKRSHRARMYYTWHQGRIVQTFGTVMSDPLHGEYQVWRPDGTPFQKGAFYHGLKHGSWKEFDTKGALIKEEKWRKGKLKKARKPKK